MNDMTRVTTGEVRLSYVHLFRPYAFQAGQEELEVQLEELLEKCEGGAV